MIQLYFDGALKGKPKEAGVGEVIVNLEEEIEIKFSWGLRIMMNNQVEAPFLWQGLNINVANGIKMLTIVGDSMMIIQKCVKLFKNENLLEHEMSKIMIGIIYL